MKFKEIAFTSKNASRIYKDYVDRIQHVIKTLDKQNQLDILLEINSHIYESISQTVEKKGEEVDTLLNVLEKLGQPEIFLKSLVAEKKLEEATQSFNPIKIAKALILNIGNGFSYIVFTILYLLLFAFLFLIVAKIIFPEDVGFFYRAHDIFILGIYKNSEGMSYSQYEQLGNWFIPVMCAAMAVLYITLTLLLNLKRKLTHKL